MLTGIPMTNLMAAERDRVLNLDKALMSRIIGQDEAVKSISNAVSTYYMLLAIKHLGRFESVEPDCTLTDDRWAVFCSLAQLASVRLNFAEF